MSSNIFDTRLVRVYFDQGTLSVEFLRVEDLRYENAGFPGFVRSVLAKVTRGLCCDDSDPKAAFRGGPYVWYLPYAEYEGPTPEVDVQTIRARLSRLAQGPAFAPSNQYDSGWRAAIAAVQELLETETEPLPTLTDEDIVALAGEAVCAMGDVFYDGEAFGDPQVCNDCGWEGKRSREYLAECPRCGEAIPTLNERLEEQVIGCVIEAINKALDVATGARVQEC